MKKGLNKFLSIIISVTMIFTMSVTAFAADGGESQPKKLDVTNNYSMFKVSEATITENGDGNYTLNLLMNSTSYDKAFAGVARAAANASEVIIADQNETGETSKFVMTLDGSQVNKNVTVSFHSKRKATWYNRTINVNLTDAILTTDNSDIAPVADDAAEIPFDASGATSSLGMFDITGAQSVVNGDGTIDVTLIAGNASRAFTKIALINQDASDSEKDAVAIVGTPVADSTKNEYMFTFTIDVTQIGSRLAISHYQVKDGFAEWKTWTDQKYLTINSTPLLVDQLIAAIYIQVRNEYTDKMCTAAKTCWNALSDAQKAQVVESDYFALNTGDASKDDPLNQDGIGEKELLVVSFGTSFNDSRVSDIGGIETALREAYPEYQVRRAFTSQIIINHIQSRDDEKIDNIDQALERAVENGVTELVVQPTHLMHGLEYEEMCNALDAYRDKIDNIIIAEPLLNSSYDKSEVAKAIIDEAAKDAGFASAEEAVASTDTAFVLMGHGTTHEADANYEEIQNTFESMNYNNVFVGTVDAGEKEEYDPKALSVIKEAVKAAGYKKVVLRPLMVVAGDHANNDMANMEDEESWASAFKADGFDVESHITGLGSVAEIQKLYVEHSACAIGKHQLAKDNVKPATMYADGENAYLCRVCEKTITEPIAKIASVKLSYTSTTYNGKAKSPTVSVVDAAGNKLVRGTDYDVKVPTGRVNAGKYTYKVVFKGNYSGSKTLNLTINQASYTPTVKGYSGTYDGKKHTISLSGLKSGSTIKYRTSPTGTWTTTKPTRTSVGKTTVYYQITNKNYKTVKGSKTIVINPVKTSITSLSKGTKSFTVKWAKKTTQTTGYQIQYSSSRTFESGNKTVTVTSNKATSKTIKSLKAKKKYYVRVRTYKTVKGVKYYSGWSAKKYVTTR